MKTMKKTIPRWARLLGFAMSFVLLTLPTARAAGPNGMNGTFLSSAGGIDMTASAAAAFTAAGTGWVRAGASLPSGHTSWDSYSLGQLDAAVNNARAAGLQIVMLLNHQSISGPFSTKPWNNNANETNGAANGGNAFQTNFINQVVLPLVQHFHGRVNNFEIWNEPWDTTGANMYPSCLAQLQTSSWIASHATLGYSDVNIIIGDGHDGAYLNSVYAKGTTLPVNCFRSAHDKYGTYPVDGFAQHVYIDSGTTTTSAHVKSYTDGLRNAISAWESGISKGTYITEFGWNSDYPGITQQIQANNMDTAFQTFNVGASGSYVKCACWYNWQDSSDGVNGFGIFNSSGGQKTDYSYYLHDTTYQGRYVVNGSLNQNILNYYNSKGQPVLGNPLNLVHTWSGGAFSADVQDCDGGSNLRLCMLTTSLGTFEVNDVHGLWDYYYGHGGIGFFGAPKNDESTVGGVTRQNFQNGLLTQDSTNGIVWHKPAYDFSGDGKADVIVFHRGATGDPNLGHVWVGTSGPGNVFTTGLWNNNFCINSEIPAVGDFNGDGKVDIATFLRGTGGTVYVAISGGTSFGTGAIWVQNFCLNNEIPMAGDFNGDGKDDIITFHRGVAGDGSEGRVYVSTSTGTAFNSGALWDSFFCISNEIPVVGDFNGDGKCDIATFLSDTSGACYVATSSGSAFNSSSIWSSLICTNGEIPVACDVNGDGKCDIVIFHRANDANQGVYVALSNGSSFGARQKWTSGFSLNSDQPGSADFGGDGKGDIVDFVRGTSGTVFVEFSTGANSFAPPPATWNTWLGVGSEIVFPAATPVLFP